MYKIKLNLKNCRNLNDLKEFIKNNNIKLVLFGEYHGFINQIQVQRKIIQNINPDFFLYELFEEKKILNNKEAKEFLNTPSNKEFSFISKYEHLKPMVKLARSFNLPIIGCDLKNMGCKKDWRNKRFTHQEINKITKKRIATG